MRYSWLAMCVLCGCSGAPEQSGQTSDESTETVATAEEALHAVPILPANAARFSYQGQFQFDDCGSNNVGNGAWSNAASLSCPFSGSTVNGTRSVMPESLCGGNQFQCRTFGFSISTSLKFGGLFQVDDCGGSDSIGNTMLEGGFGCPLGYFQDAIGRVKAPESSCGAWQFVCDARPNESTGNALQDKVRWAGQYQIDDCGTNTRSNPLTGAPNCPTGYAAIWYGRVKAPEGNKCGVSQFVCVGREP